MAINGEKRILGFKGESKAAHYLKKNGYEILERNYKCPFGEIDIIAGKDDVIAFVEVKTRTGDSFGAPNEAVDERRRQRYVRSAKFYFSGREIDCVVRFDVIEVYKGEINHIVSAFGE